MSVAIKNPLKRSERTRRLIIDNASRIFLEHGFRNVSVEDLCKAIGISRGTFYKYFPNRDALVETVFDETISELLPLIIENFNSDKDVVQIIEIHYTQMAELFTSKISTRMMAEMESRIPRIRERLEKLRRAEAEAREELFKRGQEEGSIRKDIDPVTMSLLIDEMIRSISKPGFLISKGLTLNQAGSMINAILLHGIVEPNKK